MIFKSKSPNINQETVLEKLRLVQDPDLRKDIVSLGFVKQLKIEGAKVSFQVELTTPACPVKEQLKAQCEEVVKSIKGVETVEVTMTANVRPGTTQSNRIALPSVKNVIAIASGKGGVGKSTVTINLSMALAAEGARVGLLDADIYGPSVPLMMGTVDAKPESKDKRVIPIERSGVKMMSMGYLIPPGEPVVWRGPMVHGALTQFLNQVEWGDLDYLLIDMPPGTGDAQLTISQSAPLSGAIIVTTPQEVSLIDARKGLKMFQNVKVPILGVIENMSGFVCGHCQEVTPIFRQGGGQKIAQEAGVELLGTIPLDPKLAETSDLGHPMVLSNPDSEVSNRYRQMARQIAARLSVMSLQNGGSFKPLSMEWQS
ncbi:iron-sulfur cluster carrier protein ApbC [bacterium]|nr:iron-sulfur cluster carrier protein ApbC [bacterium]